MSVLVLHYECVGPSVCVCEGSTCYLPSCGRGVEHLADHLLVTMVYGKTRTRFSIDEILGNTGAELKLGNTGAELKLGNTGAELRDQDVKESIKREHQDTTGELGLLVLLIFRDGSKFMGYTQAGTIGRGRRLILEKNQGQRLSKN